MIIVDTNVISEMMKAVPDDRVRAWFNTQNATELALTTITIAEINYGLEVLPAGRRRQRLQQAFYSVIEAAFENRILDFDLAAAGDYGRVMAERRAMGQPLSNADGQIAAIARAGNHIVATRNVNDFEDCGIQVIDPFQEQ